MPWFIVFRIAYRRYAAVRRGPLGLGQDYDKVSSSLVECADPELEEDEYYRQNQRS